MNAELLVDVAHVRLHRIAREDQFFGDGRHVAAAHDEHEHFSLALRKVVRVAHELGRGCARDRSGACGIGNCVRLGLGQGCPFWCGLLLASCDGVIEGKGGAGEQIHKQESRHEHLGFAGDVGVEEICGEHVGQNAGEHHNASHGAVCGPDTQVALLCRCDSGFHDEVNHEEEAGRTQGQGHEACAWPQGGGDQDGGEEQRGESQQHGEDRGDALANEPHDSKQRGCGEVHCRAHDEARGQLEDVDHEHGVYEWRHKGQHDGGRQHGGKVA